MDSRVLRHRPILLFLVINFPPNNNLVNLFVIQSEREGLGEI